MPQPPQLATTRLVLDAFQATDAQSLFNYASRPAVAKWMAWEQHRILKDSRDALNFLMRGAPGQYDWAIRLRASDELVGGFSFFLNSATTAEIHFTVAEPHWGRGLATEAGHAVLAWAWSHHADLGSISTAPVAENVAGRKVLERLGFTASATRRSYSPKFPAGIEVIDYVL